MSIEKAPEADGILSHWITPAYGVPGPTCEVSRVEGYYTVEALTALGAPAAERLPGGAEAA